MTTPAPLPELAVRLRDALQAAARRALGKELLDLHLTSPPSPSHGDFAIAACLPLAKELKRSPRDIAQSVAQAMEPVPGVARIEVAGPGYLNVFLDRKAVLLSLLRHLRAKPAPPQDVHDAPPPIPGRAKIIVEHTNINPNKAAHIGHLRNAVLGDCLVRVLQDGGSPVEVQNYIDDTGVQVGDVVVAFTAMSGRSAAEALPIVRRMVESPERPFDHECWDLYAAVGRWYAEDAARLSHRREALHAMENRQGATSELGELVAMSVVRRHLALMDRIGVRYHLLPRESDVLASRFWAMAFERMKAAGAVHLATEGKNAGCWVMPLTETDEFKNLEDPDKVIVRGDGTVTYVGKDIAYQMWKLGLVEKDFSYRPFHDYGDGKIAWSTDMRDGATTGHPPFGRAQSVYNVIDVRQSYLQQIVRNALVLLGHLDAAEASVHYAYEMVALTPRTAESLGFALTDEDRAAAYIEMSGRRGLGVKADDLLDRLSSEARVRVAAAAEGRGGMSDDDVARTAEQIAVGALRYYMARITRNRVIAFDIDEALQFQGETGPYLQYSAVRAANVFRRLKEEGEDPDALLAAAESDDFDILRDDPTWELVLAAARVPEVAERTRASLEMTALAKHGFLLCQSFNAFYRDHRILRAESPALQRQRAAIAQAFLLAHRGLLSLLGVPEPERM